MGIPALSVSLQEPREILSFMMVMWMWTSPMLEKMTRKVSRIDCQKILLKEWNSYNLNVPSSPDSSIIIKS
jgi:hypothetical protein